ncbi:prolyl oligopeptidase family serine peptidase [Rubinisphaera margarita]|uniref:prolyl oligopeptidase family serine peptidase n=1 Tax=Rubinisphaera margarita TaxID=2909586 RepID=UPI001EE9A566|nr:prolyl oligopeptidase family serine peptidase [Rubinisphaera margarita]MCG6155796.1 prolyl oligopeptidase family serine peptidase [Rubinisphaera margarita]
MAADLDYPETKKVDQVDTYHGVEVEDPYRWLEKDVREADDVRQWVEAENQVTDQYLSQIPARDKIEKELTKLWDYAKYSAPFKAGDRYFFQKNDGLQNQSVLYTMKSLDDEPEVLIDPNKWSEDGTVALSNMSFSDDGRYLAYGVQDAGSDWRTWHIMNVATRELLPEKLEWLKFTSAEWTPDGKGFFYGRFDEPEEGEAFQSLNLNHKLYYHRVGTPQSDDVLVYQRPDEPEWGFGPTVTDDGRYLIITVWKGTADKYRVFVKDLTEPYGIPVPLIDHFENEYTFLTNDGAKFYFKTDLDAPNKRVITIDLRNPQPENYVEVIPEAKEPMESINVVANQFVVSLLKDVKTQVKMYSLDGKPLREVELPGIGTASGFEGKRTDIETFYSFASFTTPPSIYRHNMITGESELFRRSEIEFDESQYELKQVFYKSKDGTKVPMFIAHKKGLKLDGNNPTLLYAYGGFNISLTPYFSISRAQWLEMGGVYCVANLRGGGEYGEDWHKGGMLQNKQNVFDDFIAAAEWLIDNKYTSTPKLAIQGGSNGGLLVGACMTQRPELFGACLPAVGVMDMLRFQKFTAGRYWVDEYGSSDDPELFKVLNQYSPYHQLKKGTKYPATMVTTADTDDRVVPGHSFKFAARLQEYNVGEEPVLIRIETKAGHGSGKPTSKIIEELADVYAFLVKELEMEYK